MSWRRFPTSSVWLAASIALEAGSVVVLAATVGWVGVTLYAGAPVAWWLFAALMGVIVLLRAAAAIAAGGFGARLGTGFRRRALIAAMQASPDRVRSKGPGAGLAAALDVESVGDFFVRTSAGWILGIIEIVAAVAIAQLGGLPAAVMLTLVCAIAVLVALAVGLLRARVRWRKLRLEVTNHTVEGLLGLETAQALDDEYVDSDAVDSLMHEYGKSAARMDAITVGLGLLPGLALLAILRALMWEVGAPDSIRVAMGIGVALLAVSGLERLTSVAADAVATVDAAQSLRELSLFRSAPATSAERAPVATPALMVQDREPRASPPVGGDVLLSAAGVTATFGPNLGLVDPVDLVVREGDRLLVSAPSGFGKTTLGEVLAGEREPSSGTMWRRHDVTTARVLQADDDHMFGNSLMFNIACGVEWPPSPATQARVAELVAELGLDDLVDSMPAGLAQPIGDGGWRLSTGERTRVSLASAMLREPDVLILDESVAALDGDTRERVLAASVRHSKATVLFAHWD